MINIFEVAETNKMIEKENLDVRTITLGISLLNCIDSDLRRAKEKIYEKITTRSGVWDPDCEQTDLRDTYFTGGGCGMQKCGRFCGACKDAGPCGQVSWSEFCWRLFCVGVERHDESG